MKLLTAIDDPKGKKLQYTSVNSEYHHVWKMVSEEEFEKIVDMKMEKVILLIDQILEYKY